MYDFIVNLFYPVIKFVLEEVQSIEWMQLSFGEIACYRQICIQGWWVLTWIGFCLLLCFSPNYRKKAVVITRFFGKPRYVVLTVIAVLIVYWQWYWGGEGDLLSVIDRSFDHYLATTHGLQNVFKVFFVGIMSIASTVVYTIVGWPAFWVSALYLIIITILFLYYLPGVVVTVLLFVLNEIHYYLSPQPVRRAMKKAIKAEDPAKVVSEAMFDMKQDKHRPWWQLKQSKRWTDHANDLVRSENSLMDKLIERVREKHRGINDGRR